MKIRYLVGFAYRTPKGYLKTRYCQFHRVSWVREAADAHPYTKQYAEMLKNKINKELEHYPNKWAFSVPVGLIEGVEYN